MMAQSRSYSSRGSLTIDRFGSEVGGGPEFLSGGGLLLTIGHYEISPDRVTSGENEKMEVHLVIGKWRGILFSHPLNPPPLLIQGASLLDLHDDSVKLMPLPCGPAR